jgi:hypothetical protein
MISGALEFMNEWDECPRFTFDSNHGPTLSRNKTGSIGSSSVYDEFGVDDDSDGDDEGLYATNKGVASSWDADMRERERLMNEQDEKEKRAVNISRTLVLLALCTVAFIVGHLIYFFVKNTEMNDFSDTVRCQRLWREEDCVLFYVLLCTCVQSHCDQSCITI